MSDGKSQSLVFLVLGAIVVGGAIYAIRHRPQAFVPPVLESGSLSHSIDIDFYVDGSGSMKNLLAGRGENYLHNLLSHAEATLRNPPVRDGWVDEKVRFWTFGRDIKPLIGDGRLTHLANSPAEFNEPRTSIEVPAKDDPQVRINAPSPHPEVKVIVTDLYQSDQENEKPADALAAKYLSDRFGAVAVFGVRNPYSGPVEDLPGLHGRSLPNAADSMPFYVIVSGANAADVREVETLLLSPEGAGLQSAFDNKSAFLAFFSKDPGVVFQQAPSFDWRRSKDNKRTGTGEVVSGHYGEIPTLSLRSGTVVVSWPEMDMDHGKIEERVGQDPELVIHALVSRREGVNQEEPAAQKAVTLCGAENSVCAIIDRSKLVKGRVYLLRFDKVATHPTQSFGRSSRLISQWGIEEDEVGQIASGDRKFPFKPGLAGSHPGRTPNLSQFLLALQGQTFHVKDVHSDPVRLATYYLYVKAAN